LYADLTLGYLSFECESFDYVTAHHVLEHIMRISFEGGETKYPLIQLMNKIFRVHKPGGIFFNIQPCFPAKEAFQNPTHVNIMSEDTSKNIFVSQLAHVFMVMRALLK
jgi:SAM-dependent methyltransferase